MKERAGTVPDESGSRLTSAELDAGGPGAVPADEYAYQYDDIGNRITSTDLTTNRTYTANFLNQYTFISNLCDSVTLCDDFVPQYDLDGNQTLVKTSTGVWQVSYNGENRPVLWTCGTTNIVMAYDRMGRRVLSRETVDGAVTDSNFSFVYDGYLCIQRLNATTRNVKLIFTWDPLEKVATRPLMVEKPGKYKMHVTHDGNKNVSELVFFSGGSGIAAHYEYAPFGALTASTRSTSVTAYDLRTYNPFRFSSEYADDTLGLVYYNYRHYNPMDGRWTSRDPLGERYISLYAMVANESVGGFDLLGLATKTYDLRFNGRYAYVFVGYAPGSCLANQMARYKREWVTDVYRVKIDYTESCENKIADIRITNMDGDLLGSLDHFGVAVAIVGAGMEYKSQHRETAVHSKGGRHVDLHVTVTVYREIYIGITPGMGSLSVDLGWNLNFGRKEVVNQTIVLSYECCPEIGKGDEK